MAPHACNHQEYASDAVSILHSANWTSFKSYTSSKRKTNLFWNQMLQVAGKPYTFHLEVWCSPKTESSGVPDNLSQRLVILTSAGANAQRSPRAVATLWPSELGRSRITALAPWSISRSTVALPKPEAPPVTSPTIPLDQGTKQGHVKSFTVDLGRNRINHFLLLCYTIKKQSY